MGHAAECHPQYTPQNKPHGSEGLDTLASRCEQPWRRPRRPQMNNSLR